MGKYERLERLIRINSLIRNNLMDFRFELDATQRSMSCKSDVAERSALCHRFAEDDQTLVGNGTG